ncbi:hypothetical protein [Clostridium sp. B9]|uniref:hypothetical protein n=1 Tax=Clostridium sp. B9 TaxID=3423224 RepID=UPI003D2F3A08
MSELISYSIKAKAHDLALLNLKSQDLSSLTPEELANKYLEIYSKIFDVLEDNRPSKKKIGTSMSRL